MNLNVCDYCYDQLLYLFKKYQQKSIIYNSKACPPQKEKIVHQKIPSRYVYFKDKKLSLVNFQDMKVATLKKKKRVTFLDNFYKFKKLIYTIIKETSKSSPIGI